jgi:ribonuclease PH
MRVKGALKAPPLRDQVAAISVGFVEGELALDLCYAEDSIARVDLNAVGTARGNIVELQGTAEGEALPRADMDKMIDLAMVGISSMCEVQRSMLEKAGVSLSALVTK